LTPKPYDIVLLGDYFYDLIYSGLPEFPALGREIFSAAMTSTGGAMFITAAALRRLGANVGWAGTFGSDEYSAFVRELALREGIDLRLARTLDRPYRRITTSMPLGGERAFVTYFDPEPEDHYDYWREIAETAAYRHLHLGGVMPAHLIMPILTAAQSHGATTSMDCQDAPELLTACDWKQLLKVVTVFMPNAREALMVTCRDDVRSALRLLMEWVNVVVIKDGANGAWIGHSGQVIHVPGIDAGDVIDTTGAGDCFNAGFLHAWVVEKQPLEVCGLFGNICGGLSVTGVGGATHAPTRDELQSWLDRLSKPTRISPAHPSAPLRDPSDKV
jgi:sugar/nucleoside kinase (ribokinase family)